MSKAILFQGDSITDCGRARDNNASVGTGYPLLVKAELGAKSPNEYVIYNRGVSGNRVGDLYARIKKDFINLKPDYASIYIGVNDAWHEINDKNGVDTEKFEKIYTMLLDEIFAVLPDIKLIIIAPYVLHGPATADSEAIPNRWELFQRDVAEKVEACRRIADKYNLPLIELQPAFNKACEKAEPAYWTADGVHPTAFGHQLIKELWLEAFEKIK